MRAIVIFFAAVAALLAGCSEPDQVKTSANTNRSDVEAWQGTKDPFVVNGWTPGNQGSWESQIRARGQLQNEYVRIN